MKVYTPEISWHAKDPIYSCDFQYIADDIFRLATCGTDRNIRLWEVVVDSSGKGDVVFLSNLSRHTRTVNVVRFSPDGQILASGGDDSVIMLWKRNDFTSGANNIFAEDEEDNKETWSVFKILRSHLEDVYDISWSADGKHMLSGSVDNTAILWDIKKGQKLWIFTEHKSFVQGVSFDPLEQYMATMCSDRSCRIYHYKSRTVAHNVSKVCIPNTNNNDCEKPKSIKMFHDDTLKSFFRRLSFSPDGKILVVPAGCIEKGQGEKPLYTTYVFSRTNLAKPALYLPSSSKASLVVRFSPVLYKLRPVPKQKCDKAADDKTEKDTPVETQTEEYETLFGLPYRMVYAIATEDSVILYDTQQATPFAHITKVHYHQLSDLTWSHNGQLLVIGSTDGYCTIVSFKDGEIGEPYEKQVIHVKTKNEILQEIEARNKKGLLKSHKRSKKSDENKDVQMDTGESEAAAASKPNTQNGTTVDIPSTENKGISDSKPGTSSSGDNDKSSNTTGQKQPRRVTVTTLQSSSMSSPSANESPKSAGDKTPRRVQMTTLATPSKADTSKTLAESPSMKTPQGKGGRSAGGPETPKTGKDTTPRRVQVKTLSTYIDKASEETPEEELHLVLEETNDVCQLTEEKLKLENTPAKNSNKTEFATPKSSKETCRSVRHKQPRAAESPGTSQSNSSPKPRRVQITTLSTPQK